jgi:hypothetical protein
MNIRELAEQAGLDWQRGFTWSNEPNRFSVFALLVAEHEREECAKVVDKRLSNWASLAGKDKAYKWLEKLANAIRERGKA